MRIDRVWAMPNKATFTIKPIAELLKEEINECSWNYRREAPYGDANIVKIERLWIDPFCGENSPAHITNDLNPVIRADFNVDAIEFLKIFDDESVDGILYDPPYSVRQVAECYKKVGYQVTQETTRADWYTKIKREITRITKVEGKVICFGWNSGGIGKTLGFEMTRILLVPGGGIHNDTIVTVEIKKGN